MTLEKYLQKLRDKISDLDVKIYDQKKVLETTKYKKINKWKLEYLEDSKIELTEEIYQLEKDSLNFSRNLANLSSRYMELIIYGFLFIITVIAILAQDEDIYLSLILFLILLYPLNYVLRIFTSSSFLSFKQKSRYYYSSRTFELVFDIYIVILLAIGLGSTYSVILIDSLVFFIIYFFVSLFQFVISRGYKSTNEFVIKGNILSGSDDNYFFELQYIPFKFFTQLCIVNSSGASFKISKRISWSILSKIDKQPYKIYSQYDKTKNNLIFKIIPVRPKNYKMTYKISNSLNKTVLRFNLISLAEEKNIKVVDEKSTIKITNEKSVDKNVQVAVDNKNSKSIVEDEKRLLDPTERRALREASKEALYSILAKNLNENKTTLLEEEEYINDYEEDDDDEDEEFFDDAFDDYLADIEDDEF
jgi:hypothetical protein